MAIVVARAKDAPALTTRDHVLLRLRGDLLCRHAVVVSESTGTAQWILTPGRSIELFDFGSRQLVGAKLWSGKKLPASVTPGGAFRDVDSAKGAFTEGEITESIALAGRQDPSSAVG